MRVGLQTKRKQSANKRQTNEKQTENKKIYMSNATYFVGIDPDNQASGVGVVNKETKQCFALRFKFSELVDWLSRLKDNYGENVKVYVEGGWLNKSNWHMRGAAASPAKAAAMGRNVGMNHQTVLLLVEMCSSIGIPCEVVKPLRKGWSGPDRKITAEELEHFTGWNRRTNQDARDAALLAWVYAGLPVRVKVWREE